MSIPTCRIEGAPTDGRSAFEEGVVGRTPASTTTGIGTCASSAADPLRARQRRSVALIQYHYEHPDAVILMAQLPRRRPPGARLAPGSLS